MAVTAVALHRQLSVMQMYPSMRYIELIYQASPQESMQYFLVGVRVQSKQQQSYEWREALDGLRTRIGALSHNRWWLGVHIMDAQEAEQLVKQLGTNHRWSTACECLESPHRLREVVRCDHCCQAIERWTPECYTLPVCCQHRGK
jgi:hypothetical protein